MKIILFLTKSISLDWYIFTSLQFWLTSYPSPPPPKFLFIYLYIYILTLEQSTLSPTLSIQTLWPRSRMYSHKTYLKIVSEKFSPNCFLVYVNLCNTAKGGWMYIHILNVFLHQKCIRNFLFLIWAKIE